MRRIFSILLFLILQQLVLAQPSNDDCISAINIPSVDDYCSDNMAFTNLNASSDPSFPDNCFHNYVNGVWFSFSPQEPAVLIQVFSGIPQGTMGAPQMVLFTGSCNNLQYIGCSPGSNAENDEFTQTDLTIGQTYYLLVEGDPDFEGTFQLCINDFVPVPSPESDCPDAVVLCDKSPFSVPNLQTPGLDNTEVEGTCMDNSPGPDEFASSWYKWTCKDPGTLTFTLTPNDYISDDEISDDLDFVVFELPNGLDRCEDRIVLRCMASGANGTNGVTDPLPSWRECNGLTGLAIGDGDVQEDPGCQQGNNNFAEAINMEAGKSYALIVMNFSRSGLGFGIEFGGTGTFLGPEPDFDLMALDEFECDKRIDFTNLSNSDTDPIVNYAWNFGVGATPTTETGEGPHPVVYESFGEKSIALTVETARGCIVTKILDVFIEPCCDDLPDLDITTDVQDLICNGVPEGSILAQGIAGSPDYLYSFNGGPFQPAQLFNNLEAGTYDVIVQDIKGCETATTITIDEPPPLMVNAGPDITVDLGFSGNIFGTITPPNADVTITWDPEEGLDCPDSEFVDCLNPTVVSPGTTTYTVTIEDAAGCTASDQLTVTTNIIRPIYAPNVITPTTNDINSIFALGVGPQVEVIEELCIFDRWGSIVWIDTNLGPNEPGRGWNGRFASGAQSDVVIGVYVWQAQIRFIDGEVITYTGDVTVLR